MAAKRKVVSLIMAAWVACQAGDCLAQSDVSVKIRVASALLRFVEFPDSREKSAPLRFCVLSARPLPRTAVEVIQKGGSIAVVEVRPEAPVPQCDVLYVDASATAWRSILEQPQSSWLTISDTAGFLVAGGAVELIQVDDAVRFDVNLAELRRQRIRMSAQALKLARKVQE